MLGGGHLGAATRGDRLAGVQRSVRAGRDGLGMTASRGVNYCRTATGDFRSMKRLVQLDQHDSDSQTGGRGFSAPVPLRVF